MKALIHVLCTCVLAATAGAQSAAAQAPRRPSRAPRTSASGIRRQVDDCRRDETESMGPGGKVTRTDCEWF